mgnify:CR=1 FL=1
MSCKKIKDTVSRSKSQKGAMTLFIAFIIFPVLFALFTLSLDLSVYYTASQRAQKVADEAVVYAYRFLPSEQDAQRALELYLSQNSENIDALRGSTEINISPDFISMAYRGISTLTFANLLGLELALPYHVSARARSTPLDIYLAMDSSAYLVPDVLGSDAWGNAAEWPAADYFRHEQFFYKLDTQVNPPLSHKLDERVITQQCFNPVFSETKRAAVHIFDYLSSFRLNTIGLGFFPGYLSQLDTVREVSRPGPMQSGLGEANFMQHYGYAYHASIYCAAAAEKEINNPAYRFPQYSSLLNQAMNCPSAGAQSILDPFSPEAPKLNPDYMACLKAREVIWSRAINPQDEQNLPGVINNLNNQLLAVQSAAERGGLLASPVKVGIILSGDLPRSDGLRFPDAALTASLSQSLNHAISEVERLNANYTLYLVIFRHQGINDPNWENNLIALQAYFDQFNNRPLEQGEFRLRLFVADSSLRVAEEIISMLLLQKKTAMLAN